MRAYTQESRRAYRDLFITATGIGSALAGTILHKETLYQRTVGDDKPFVECLQNAGILPGVKVDEVREGELLGSHLPSKTSMIWDGYAGTSSSRGEQQREPHAWT